MTALVDFLAGNAIALVVVATIGLLALVVFTLGGESRHRTMPTHPITTAAALRVERPRSAGARDPSTGAPSAADTPAVESPAADAAAADPSAERSGGSPATGPVAVVGRVVCDAPVRTPFVGDPAVAYEVAVSGPFGYVATVRDATQFELDVEGERVHVDPTAGTRTSRPEVDDDRREHTFRRLRATALEDVTRDALARLDRFRSRRQRYLSGSVLPGATTRTYSVRSVQPGDDVAVVGRLERDGDGYVLRAPDDGSLRVLDPEVVTRNH